MAYMGQPPDQPRLLEHLKAAGITRQPQPDAGEDMAYVQFSQQGYEMRFDRTSDGLGLFLRSITAYPSGDATHQPFAGELPQGIQAGDVRADLHAKLGLPAFHNKVFNTDMWKTGELELVVRFDKVANTIKIVQVNAPKR